MQFCGDEEKRERNKHPGSGSGYCFQYEEQRLFSVCCVVQEMESRYSESSQGSQKESLSPKCIKIVEMYNII